MTDKEIISRIIVLAEKTIADFNMQPYKYEYEGGYRQAMGDILNLINKEKEV